MSQTKNCLLVNYSTFAKKVKADPSDKFTLSLLEHLPIRLKGFIIHRTVAKYNCILTIGIINYIKRDYAEQV